MNALFALILIGALGFILGRFLFLKPRPGSLLQRVFLSGLEFLLLGALIGPRGVRLLGEEELTSLEPFLLLSLTWVGLLVGLQLRVGQLVRFPPAYFRLALIQSLAALAFAFALLGAVLHLWNPFASDASDRLRAALCLGAVAALSSPTEAALHARGARGGRAAGLLRFVPAIDPLVALGATAALFAVWHVADAGGLRAFQPWMWVLVSLAGGLLLGLLFLLLLRAAEGQDEIVLVVIGMAIFTGGLASVFHLSPLVVGLVEGVLLANLFSRVEALIHIFLRMERPLYVALLVLAGAAWRFDLPWGYVLAAIYLAVRLLAKYAGARLALAAVTLPFRPGGRWWLGLMPQGAMAVAIAVSYGLVYRDALSQSVFSAVLVSTVLLSLLSGRLMARALPEGEETG